MPKNVLAGVTFARRLYPDETIPNVAIAFSFTAAGAYAKRLYPDETIPNVASALFLSAASGSAKGLPVAAIRND